MSTQQQQQQIKKFLKQNYLGKTVRVTTKNHRIFVGKLVSIDFRTNIILTQAIAQILPQFHVPLNATLSNSADSKFKFQPDANLSQEENQLQRKKYNQSHYYFGNIMITGQDIQSLEIKNQPVKQQQNKPTQNQ